MTMMAICWSLVTASIRGEMQYRLNFLIEIAVDLVYQSVGFVFILIVLGQFEAIEGWSLHDVTLLYGLRLAGHGLWSLLFSRLLLFDEMVQQGDYDRMLLRPMPSILQLMFGGFRVAALGDALGGIVLLGVAISIADVEWSAFKVLFLIAAVIGGAMLDGAFQLGPAALTFRFLNSASLRGFFDNLFSQYGGYPLSIFERRVRNTLTFVLPLAFMAWVPATVLLGRTDELPFPAPVAWASPLIGAALLFVAYRIFRHESRHYQSAGS